MKFMDALRKKAKARAADDETARNTVLFVWVGDAGWRAELIDGEEPRWKAQEALPLDSPAASPPEQLGSAIAKFTSEQPQTNVGRVVLSIDDPDLHLVDHRFARLTNFEPRAIREFGQQQAGGRPIAFAYMPFGASGAREIEKRTLAFLPEEKLESYFFALGKLATALVSVRPAAAGALVPEFHDGGIFATLRVHGYFSTLMIANGDTGIVAARHIPFGSLMLAQAYAEQHGVTLSEASNALKLRSRLPPLGALKDGGLPEYNTATFAALAPPLRQMQEEIASTIEYFRYQRLAGRPASMSLAFTAAPIAGLQAWLSEAFEMQVETIADVLPAAEAAEGTSLNLLEGSRAGLLKLGHQPYEYSRGRFAPMKGAQSDKMPTNKAPSSLIPAAWLEKLRVPAMSKPITVKWDSFKPTAFAAAFIVLAIAGNMFLLTGPSDERLAAQASAYSAQAASSVAFTANGSEAGLPVGERPNLWADTLLGIGKALLPSMKLNRLELVNSAGKGAGDPSLAITGALPQGGANLKLVAGFIDHLSQDQSFSRRYGQVRFTGAGETAGEGARATPAAANGETLFHVVGLGGGRK